MAAAKKCVICGKLYELYGICNDNKRTNGIMLVNIDSKGKYFTHDAIDCCPDCMDSIRGHIETLKKGVSHIND